jgi:Fe-S-cluster containining protein
MLEKYAQYLYTIDKKLSDFFTRQKDYIFCKEGCSHCCEDGEYPYTQVEMLYLMCGFNELDQATQLKIVQKVKDLKQQKARNTDKKFMHECPFLLDKRCSLYEQRGLICRTHGLAFHTDGHLMVPSCIYKGLNYANVYDKEANVLTSEKCQELGFETEPVAFNLSRKFLLNNEGTQYLGLDFGEERPMMGWLEEVFPG